MLQLADITKTYEGQLLLSGISFSVDAGETICLLGPSGSGKSTLLRIVAGLELPESGQVLWNGTDLAEIPPHLRDFGLVFQDYALFPHLDVFANVAFGLKMRELHHAEIDLRVASSLEQVNMNGFEKRHVTDLSGGEQQRIALARALAIHPRLLMFDEPLGALDRALKEDLLNELRAILHGTGIPAIYVTHDQEEAFAIADRILILHEGHVVCEGNPVEVTANPRSAWVAKFLGLGNVLEGKVKRKNKESLRIETSLGMFDTEDKKEVRIGETVSVLIRPEKAQRGGGRGSLKSRVRDVVFQRNGYRVALENGLYFILADAPKIGEAISLKLGEVECLR